MPRTVILAALALACLPSVAEARPSAKHPHHEDRHARVEAGIPTSGCSDPVMRPCETGGVRPRGRVKAALSRVQSRGSRPRAWCGWWLSRHLGLYDRRLWRALAWRHIGRAAHGPAIGVVVIWSRGKGRGHVGIITGKTARGWVVLSGNDGNAVRERVRSVAGAVAFRWP